jgi:hypothetical protein
MSICRESNAKDTSAFGVASGLIAIVTATFILLLTFELLFVFPESTLPAPIPAILNYGIIPCLVLNGVGLLCGGYALLKKRHRRLVAAVGAPANLLLLLAIALPLSRGMQPPQTPVRPGVELTHHLRYALRLADRMEIHPIDQGDPSLSFDPIVINDSKEIQRVISGIIACDEEGFFSTCCCVGELSLLVDAGTNRLAVLSVHHGESLRLRSNAGCWQGDDWVGNIDITKESQQYLADWLHGKGVPNKMLPAYAPKPRR